MKIQEFLKEDLENPTDKVSVDVPLLIRLLEYAREDAQTDMDLHNVAERLIALSQEGRTLSMHDYNSICGSEEVAECTTAGAVAVVSAPLFKKKVIKRK